MKKFFSNIKYQLFSYSMILLFVPSCSNFLDVVPDNVFQYEDLFTSQQQAYSALAALFATVPVDNRDAGPWTLGDDMAVVSPEIDANRDWVQGASIMRGNQNTTNTLISFWTGRNVVSRNFHLNTIWAVIRECDQFIRNVDRIPDMAAEDKADWKAQAKFLKAYNLFMLVQMYGPVIIPETFVEGAGINANLMLHRSKVEDCFDEILNLINEAIPDLRGRRETQYLGQPDQVTAKAIKARILLTRASPFYNGNDEYYSNFLDHNGEHFFAQKSDPEKWKAAADAAKVALDACKQYGFKLYYCTRRPYDFDTTDFRLNPVRMQSLYNLRFRVVERWNDELIWGNMRTTGSPIAQVAYVVKPAGYGGPAPTNNGAHWIQSSYQAMERFYTGNGLPLDEDRTVDRNALHEIVNLPNENSPEYAKMRGLMKPAGASPHDKTIKMYLNREPRFYADLGVTGGYFRSHQVRIRPVMFYNTDCGRRPSPSDVGFEPPTGIAIQKLIHPEAYGTSLQTLMLYPYPIIRVADLWLMYAEAMNEYYGPSQEVWDAINEVRRRAGIPNVEESYSNREWVTDEAFEKHKKTKEGMRDIILRERANEFAFEFGHRFWDMQRWKRSVSEFSRPLYGWNVDGANAEAFFQLKNIQGRKWSITDCLWPIDESEIIRNANLIQNPGW